MIFLIILFKFLLLPIFILDIIFVAQCLVEKEENLVDKIILLFLHIGLYIFLIFLLIIPVMIIRA